MTTHTEHGRDHGDSRRPVALVAGGSRGLGLLVARELGRRGYAVAIAARDSGELDGAVARLALDGITEVQPYVCDVADPEAVTALVAATESTLGAVDVAIHVAGVIQVAPLAAIDAAMVDEAVDIMTRGPVHLALAVLPGMLERGHGRIGTVTSVGGTVSVPHLLPYSTAKFGAVGFSRGLSAELAGTGVTSTTIVPGLMRTGSHLKARFGGDAAREYAWFAPAASLPLLSMDADRAAARIVSGVLAGRNQVVLTPVAHVAMRVAGLMPSLTTTLMKGVALLLPKSSGKGPLVEGHEARDRLDNETVDRLTTLGDAAAVRNNEMRRQPPPAAG